MILALQRVFCTIKGNFPLAKNEEVLGLTGTSPPPFPSRPEAEVSLGKRSVTGKMLLKEEPGLDNLPIMPPHGVHITENRLFFRQNCGFPQKDETCGEII